MKKTFILFSIFIFLFEFSFSQPDKEQFQKAVKLRNENKFDESIAIFNQLLKHDSTNSEYLHNTAYLLCKLGNRQKEEATRQSYFRNAEYLSKKAIAINSKNAEAHYTYALALGRINEYASTKQKIANAKTIKTECEAAIKLNPQHAGAYHILGRWHETLASFSFIEKAMVNSFYGGVPEGGSYDDAIECFKKAAQYEPDHLSHKYALAETYYKRDYKDDYIYAKIWCNKVLEMNPKDSDEKETQAKAKALLKKIG